MCLSFFAESSGLLDALEESVTDAEWEEAYRKHVVVVDSDRSVLPTNLYLDGVAVTKREGVLAGWQGAELEFKPKMHLVFHLVERTRTHGNPRFYSTFLDESLNSTLRGIVRSSHRATWELRVFSKFAWVEERRAKRQRLPLKRKRPLRLRARADA